MRSIRNDGIWSSALKTVNAATLVLILGTATLFAHPEIEDHIADLTAKIAADPSNATLFAKRGELRRIHEDWDDARADLDRARALDPKLDLVDLGVGRLELDLGRPEAALEAFDRYLAANPGNPEALVFRGDALVRLGRHADAAGAFDGAIRGDIAAGRKPSPELFIARSRARFEAGGERRDAALAGIEEGLMLLASPITLELEALDLEVALGATDAAIARLDRLASATRRPESWLARRGEILEKSGKASEARASYAAALEAIESLAPHHREADSVAELERAVRAALERIRPTQAAPVEKPNDHR